MSILVNYPVTPMSKRSIELAIHRYLAMHLKETLFEPSPTDVYALLEFALFESHQYKLDIVGSIDAIGCEAKTVVLKKVIQLTEACHGALNTPGRHRFTACHEAAHVILHHDQLTQLAMNPARYPSKKKLEVYEDREWQAEHASGSLLMPLITIGPLVAHLRQAGRNEFTIINQVAEIYQVSMPAARTRIEKISQADLASLARSLRQTGGVS